MKCCETMNKTELKKLLKPLIKECIKEVIFEDGVLSGVVSEVVRGMGSTPLVESAAPVAPRPHKQKVELREKAALAQKQKIDENRKKLLGALGTEAYNGVNLFEGTAPLSSAGTAPGASPAAQGPLANVEPSDSGVDIGNLFGAVGQNWKAHMDAGK